MTDVPSHARPRPELADRAALHERVRAERAAQGLPERIEDPATLDTLAVLFRAARGTAGPPSSSPADSHL
jgi:hypothetical protein